MEARVPQRLLMQEISRGLTFTCYRNGEEIIKYTRKTFSGEDAAQLFLQNCIDEYTQLRTYLGVYVTPTTFGITEQKKGYAAYLRQPYIDGVSLKTAFELQFQHMLEADMVIDFLHKVSMMYTCTGKIPDIFGRPHLIGWYTVLTTPNVRVEVRNRRLMPQLVDVGFTRMSKQSVAGSVHNKFLIQSVYGLLNSKT